MAELTLKAREREALPPLTDLSPLSIARKGQKPFASFEPLCERLSLALLASVEPLALAPPRSGDPLALLASFDPPRVPAA